MKVKFELLNKIFVILENKNVCGYIAVSTILDEAHIVNFAVAKKHQNKGYGERLIDYIIDFSHKNSMERLLLEVRESNKTAIYLYIKKGFVYDGKRKGYYTNPSEDAVLMSRNIII